MTYDSGDGYVLLFSGSDGRNDTWSFFNNNWTEINSSSGPSPRTHPAIAYDAADCCVLLFGGTEGSSTYGDTWEYRQGNWTNVTTGVAPSPRWGAAMAYDALDGYVVLFGGLHDGQTFNDTWMFRGGNWTNITASTGPPPTSRYSQGMTYDAADGYVLMYGGWTAAHAKGQNPALNDTWRFVAGRWKELEPSSNPGTLWFLGMVYDSYDSYVVLFGGISQPGKTPNNTFPATWTYADGEWTNVTGGPAPGARFSEGISDNPEEGNVVMFGGLNSSIVAAHPLSDTWMFASGTWRNLSGHSTRFAGTFQEQGLSSSQAWRVTLYSKTKTSQNSTISFSEPTGTYQYLITPVSGYSISPSSGNITIQGGGWEVSVIFVRNSSTFLGLPYPEGYLVIAAIVVAVGMVILFTFRRIRRRTSRRQNEPSRSAPSPTSENIGGAPSNPAPPDQASGTPEDKPPTGP